MDDVESQLPTSTSMQTQPPIDSSISSYNSKLWQTCSGNISKQFIEFLTHSVTILSVFLFSAIQLNNDSENRETYIGLMSLSIGAILPNPSLKK